VLSEFILRNQTGEVFKSPVIGALCLPVKAAGRKLPHLQVKAYAVATGSLAAAWFIGAVASLQILFLLTFHVQRVLLEKIISIRRDLFSGRHNASLADPVTGNPDTCSIEMPVDPCKPDSYLGAPVPVDPQ